MKQDIRKHRFLEAFGMVVIVLALVRCAFPSVATKQEEMALAADSLTVDSVATVQEPVAKEEPLPDCGTVEATRYVPDGERYHRIKSVPAIRLLSPIIMMCNWWLLTVGACVP